MNIDKAQEAYVKAWDAEELSSSAARKAGLLAAAPHLQEPIAYPTEKEVNSIVQYLNERIKEMLGNPYNPWSFVGTKDVICEFVRRRNDPPPEPDPRVEIVAKALYEATGQAMSWAEMYRYPGSAYEGWLARGRDLLAALDAAQPTPKEKQL